MRKGISSIAAIVLVGSLLMVGQTIVMAEGNSKDNAQGNSQEKLNDPKYWGTPSQDINSDADQQNYDRSAPSIPGIQVKGVRVFEPKKSQSPSNALMKYASTGSGNLTNHGGSTLPAVTLYPIFWGPSWTSASGHDYKGDVTNFLISSKCTGTTTTTLSCSGLTNVVAQYMGSATTSINVGTTYFDLTNPPTSAPSTGTIVAEAQKVVSAAKGVLDNKGLYLVFTNNFPSRANYCGYHGAGSAKIGLVSTTIAVAYLPNPATMGGCNASGLGITYKQNSPVSGVDSVVNITTHEIYEAMSDSIQIGNAWYDAKGYENGDKCAWNFGTTTMGNGINNPAGYTVQTEYNNFQSACTDQYK